MSALPGTALGQPSARPRLAWLGLLLAAAGIGLYVLLLGVPFVRASGLPAFLGIAAGGLLLLRVLRHGRSAAVLLPALVGAALALAFLWLFFFVARLPASRGFAELAQAPDVLLPPAADGEPRDLDALLARGPVWLVFFRGHW